MTMFDPRTKLSEQVVQEVQRFFGDLVYDVIIPRTVRLSEAPGFGQPITVYDPRSKGAQTYRQLAGRSPRGRHPPNPCRSTTISRRWWSRPLLTPSHRSRVDRGRAGGAPDPDRPRGWSRSRKPRSRRRSTPPEAPRGRGVHAGPHRATDAASIRRPVAAEPPNAARAAEARRRQAVRVRLADGRYDVWEDSDEPRPAETSRRRRSAAHRPPAPPQPHPGTFPNDGWWSSTRTPSSGRPPGPPPGMPPTTSRPPTGRGRRSARPWRKRATAKRRWRLFRKGGE